MNDQSETERRSTVDEWFGLDRLRLSDDGQAVDVTIGSANYWDRSHLRRLRQSGDLPGLVPIIDSDFSADGKPFAVTPAVDAPTLASLLESGDLSWTNGAGIAEAVARAVHEAHLRGLFHGAISPDDVHVIGTDVALSGVGLGLGGSVPADRAQWAAPEVRDGDDPTERSDVFSLGKLLEASLGSSIDTAPRSIRRLIMWSSSDTPEARPPSAMEFASILAEGLGEERKTYGPAFVSTSDVSELASRASSTVTNYSPTGASSSLSDAAGGLAVAATAGAAALGGAALVDEMADIDPAIIDEGFSVAEADEAEQTVDFDIEDAQPAIDETTAPLAADVDAVAGRAAEVSTDYGVPAAAQTVDLDETFIPAKQRSRAGLVVGGVLALGLAAIAWGVLGSGDDDTIASQNGSSASAAVTTAAPTTEAEAAVTTAAPTTAAPTTAAPTTAAPTTEAEAAVTTAAPTTAAPTTAAPTTAAPTTAAPTTAATGGSGLSASDNPIAADDAGVQVLHGVPGATVDVYVDGIAIATNFTAGNIAGPIALAPGDYDVALFASEADAPANAADRTDEALISATVPVGSDPATLVAHLSESGDLALGAFAEGLSDLDPGQARITVRHLMATGPLDASINGEIVGSLQPGTETTIEVEAGQVAIELIGADGTVVTSATVGVEDGELASLSAIGVPDADTAEILIQRYTGLATAPAAVPTGDSGLLGLEDDQFGLRLVYGLMAVLALSGGAVALRRQRSWS